MISNGGDGSNIGYVFILFLNPHFHSMNLGPTITHLEIRTLRLTEIN